MNGREGWKHSDVWKLLNREILRRVYAYRGWRYAILPTVQISVWIGGRIRLTTAWQSW